MQTDMTSYAALEQWILFLSHYAITLTILLALLLDHWLGEAKKYHYLVGFGWLASQLEARFNSPITEDISADNDASVIPPFSLHKTIIGFTAWVLLVIPLPLLYFMLLNDFFWYLQIILDAVVLYLALGLNSLHKHAMQVYQPLIKGDEEIARHYTGYLVSRDTTELSPNAMARATTESMLENGHDSVIASILYFLIGGAPLVILHRFANTLDAMWGYKTQRYRSFGYACARLDDLLGFLTAKCCTVLYAIQGAFVLSMKNAYQQGNRYKSHNGGWVMAAGATVMNRTLGGLANYHGKTINSVTLGAGKMVTVDDIPHSVGIVRRAAVLLFLLTFAWQTLYQCFLA